MHHTRHRRLARLLAVLLAMIVPMTHAEQQPNTVAIVHDFTSPPQRVWQAWTDPAWVSRWFGSNAGGRVLSAQLDVRPGGQFVVTFVDADGTEHTCSGRYVEVDRDRRLQFTWQWKSEPGVQTLVTVALAPEGTGTRMSFEHSRLFQASAHDYASGWRATFAKLASVLDQT